MSVFQSLDVFRWNRGTVLRRLMISSVAVRHFPSPRPCVPTEEDKRARSDNLSLTSSDIMSSKSLMSFTSLYWGRSRLPALAVTPRCTRASVSTLRGGRKSGRPGSSRPGGSGMIARVSGCEPRAPVHPLFVRQRRRPLRSEQQTKTKTNYAWHQQDALACTCGSPSNSATCANACNPSLVHAQILRGRTLEKSLRRRGAHALQKFPRIRATSSS